MTARVQGVDYSMLQEAKADAARKEREVEQTLEDYRQGKTGATWAKHLAAKSAAEEAREKVVRYRNIYSRETLAETEEKAAELYEEFVDGEERHLEPIVAAVEKIRVATVEFLQACIDFRAFRRQVYLQWREIWPETVVAHDGQDANENLPDSMLEFLDGSGRFGAIGGRVFDLTRPILIVLGAAARAIWETWQPLKGTRRDDGAPATFGMGDSPQQWAFVQNLSQGPPQGDAESLKKRLKQVELWRETEADEY